ncbi:glycogen operon protein GlgX [Amycolatopsis sp. NPDC051758]|uniref:glycogen operon protein GlgX n=1 Tax=Amycolatopsis sp. NPDC051758 TaxID=3363935 RepID=UPI0037A40AB4
MSLDQQLQPLEPVTTPDPADDRIGARYSRLFGWPVKWRGHHPFLALENGICAVTLPKLSAGPILARLAATGCQGPALVLSTHRGPRVAVPAETDGLLPLRTDLPKDIEVLAWGALLPLPVTVRRTDLATEWLTAPDPQQRWLPSLSAVLSAVSAGER